MSTHSNKVRGSYLHGVLLAIFKLAESFSHTKVFDMNRYTIKAVAKSPTKRQSAMFC